MATFQDVGGQQQPQFMGPDAAKQSRRLAEMLMNEGMNTQGLTHWTQALGKVLQSGVGALRNDQATADVRDGSMAGNKALAQMLAGGAPDAAMANPYSAPDAMKFTADKYKRNEERGYNEGALQRQVQQRATLAQQHGMTRGTPEFQEFVLTGKMPSKPTAVEAPSNIREWQEFQRMTPEQKQEYLAMKRAQQNLDLGPAYGIPNQLRPGELQGTIPKDLAGAEKQRVVGRETGERQMAAPKAMSALNSADAKADVVLKTLDEAEKMVGTLTAGFPGAVLSKIPGTAARDLSAKIDTLKANAGFAELQAMRDNSPTGGALGQVAVQELAMLQATITSLEQAQTPQQLTKAFQDYRTFIQESKVRRKMAYDLTYGQGNGTPQDDDGFKVEFE